jgi:hypothetical protein
VKRRTGFTTAFRPPFSRRLLGYEIGCQGLRYFVGVLLIAALGGRALGDAAACRTGILDPRATAVPADITRRALDAQQPALEPLVAFLSERCTDDYHKVKRFHDWIADNISYDVDALVAGNRPDGGVAATLARRKAVCQGYAMLLHRLCELANIPCRVIDGHGRGYGFGLGRPEKTTDDNHAWNAVEIGGHWQLIDVTWDAGHIENHSFRKQYSTDYLFAAPRDFLHTHFPSDARWQLVDPPLTAAQFAALPCLEGRFFAQQLQLATPLVRLQPVGESVQFSLRTPKDLLLMARLKDPDRPNAALYPQRTLVRRDGEVSNILVTFPKAGPWVVDLLSRQRDDKGLFWQVASLEFQSSAGSRWTFPETFASYAAMDAFLYSPLYVPLVADKPQQFKIRVHGAEQVQLLLDGKKWLRMSRIAGQTDVFQIMQEIPAGADVRIMAKTPGKGTMHWALVEYKGERE